MISNILAAVAIGGIIVILVYAFFMCLIIIGLIRLVRFLGSSNKEMKLTRIELGKLAEEVSLIRKELKDGKVIDSSDKSG